jgi:hypothetical protein
MLVLSLLLAAPPAFEIDRVRLVSDAAPHSAFTDLVRFKDRWFCVFREGAKHVSPDGALRVMTSADGETWTSAALIKSDTEDLRDAKITVTPDGRLMLSGAGALHKPNPHTHQSYSWFSADGTNWSKPVPVADPGYWLWRVTWHKGKCYGFGYGCGPEPRQVHFYTGDGTKFDRTVTAAFTNNYPNEAAIAFLPDDTAICLLRRDGKEASAQMGTAKPPYTDWKWTDTKVRFGGPALIRLADGTLIAGGRLYDGKQRMSVCVLDPATGTLTEKLTLPSGGDCSYPGLVWHDGKLWVSYYSSHEGRTKVYLATVKVK